MTRDWLTAKEMDAADELVRQHDEAALRALTAQHQPPREPVQRAGPPEMATNLPTDVGVGSGSAMTGTYIPKEWPDARARAVMARHNLRVEDLTYPPPVHAKVVYAGWKHSPEFSVSHDKPVPEVGQFIPLAQTEGSTLRLRVTRREFVEEERTWYLYCEAVE